MKYLPKPYTSLKMRFTTQKNVLIATAALFSIISIGCRQQRVIAQTQADREIVREVVRDTAIVVKPDKATLKALLECDSAGMVMLKQLESYEAGTRLKPPKIAISNNLLTAEAEVDSLAIYLSWKEQHTNTASTTVITQPPVEVNRLNGFQWFLVWCGIIAIAYVIGLTGYKLIRRKLKI